MYGLLAFDVQYWNGSSWVTISGGSVTGNNKVWRKFTFSAITTSKIRVFINSVPDGWSRAVEIQAFGTSAGGEKVQWLVPDHLGTPRMIVDETGSRANVKRHDYLPFGEELYAGSGGRTPVLGYAGDGIRQQFTSKERDNETGLDYFLARYYSSVQGRFTGYDPIFVTAKRLVDPQRLNLYAYARNNPLKFVDPNGTDVTITAKNEAEARKRFAIFLRGLTPEDRKHVRFFIGDGKNGYQKGQFYIKVDQDYKSESGNFQAIQQAANDRTALAKLTVVQKGDEIKLRNTSIELEQTILGKVESFKFDNEFHGFTLFQVRPSNLKIGGPFSAGRYTQLLINGDLDEVEVSATMHHELRAHLVLGDFGRQVPKSNHSDSYARGEGPATVEADKVADAAEKEARENAKKP